MVDHADRFGTVAHWCIAGLWGRLYDRAFYLRDILKPCLQGLRLAFDTADEALLTAMREGVDSIWRFRR
jgi:hypothetical protein